MCGLTALFSARPLPADRIFAMTSAVRHRGPDDEGFTLFGGSELAPLTYGGPDTPDSSFASTLPYAPRRRLPDPAASSVAALAHRRLSILDLSAAGHQPMSSADGRYWVIYNGEIYNYLELRDELRVLGHEFRTGTDTEIIIAAYRQWGVDCLHRFNGMFAIVLLDRTARRVFCARDRFGVKPLYYAVPEDGVVTLFSEIKQVAAYPGWRSAVNGQRAYDFLAWGIVDHTAETLFEGVFQLRNGERLELDLDRLDGLRKGAKLATETWYRLEPKQFAGSPADAAAGFRELFTDAIRLRLRADVPIGTCLSGGLDSSSIVCVANRLLREQDAASVQRSFSAVSDVARFDESRFMEEVVDQTGIRHRKVLPSLEHLFDELPALTWHNDEPFGSTSIYAQWNVFRLAASDGVTVMLDGQGADEALAGYHSFFRPRFAALFLGLSWLELAAEIGAARRKHGYPATWAAKALADGVLPESAKMLLRRRAALAHDAPAWLNLKALDARPTSRLQASGHQSPRSVREESHQQLTSTNLQMLLHWEDRDSMAHSIESRVPFLDYRLVEFALGLPDEMKISGGTTKRVLREAMKGILPEAVRTRQDKLGFATPEEVWVRERQPDVFLRRMEQAVEQSRGIVNDSAVSLLKDVQSGRRAFDFTPWRIISFGAWMERFSVAA